MTVNCSDPPPFTCPFCALQADDAMFENHPLLNGINWTLTVALAMPSSILFASPAQEPLHTALHMLVLLLTARALEPLCSCFVCSCPHKLSSCWEPYPLTVRTSSSPLCPSHLPWLSHLCTARPGITVSPFTFVVQLAHCTKCVGLFLFSMFTLLARYIMVLVGIISSSLHPLSTDTGCRATILCTVISSELRQ